ncbi:putative RNA-binding protein MEX3B [Scophthalmus maximus]|uniref:Putative RNA-binding protein MEX3B n=1 Tax=Scophthalmus maximus TaxID=52904 RepID=A0A2U9BDX1_SCOMX|nr:putative RNA-binding protein MEX3B [Scophthalmus maximus]
MPSSLFADGGVQGDALEDQRALQIALDQLSLLGLDNDDNSPYDSDQEPRKKSVNMTECVPVPSSEHVAEIVGRQGVCVCVCVCVLSRVVHLNTYKVRGHGFGITVTHRVATSSAKNVYLCAGLQPGCKIKALRAKTNTYIKTPVRGEEPVFVVTGRREDVAMARREIISAAEHFSMIRASRNKNASVNGSGTPAPGPPNLPGQTTIQVRVPYRVVGLVVGPKGATIKRIQQQTHTYIVTPSRDKEPVFEVTGMPENVDRAREEIEAHIAMRTGGLIELQDENDFHANGTDVGFDLHGHATLWSKPSAGMTLTSVRKPFSNYRNDSSSSLGSASTDSYFGNNSSRMADYSPPSPALSYTTTNNNGNNNNNNINVNTNGNRFVFGSEVISPDCTDVTFDSSPGFDPTQPPPGLLWTQSDSRMTPSSTGGSSPISTSAMFLTNTPTNANGIVVNQRRVNGCTPQPRLSPPLHSHTGGPTEHPLARRVRSDPGGGPLTFPGYSSNIASLPGPHLPGVPCDSSASSSSSSSSSSTSSGTSRKGSRDCSVCFESEVIAALVPCGHNLFCMECANRICERSEPKCPVCHAGVTQAIRIFS